MAKKYRVIIWLFLLGIAIFSFSATVIWLGDDIDYQYFITDSIWNSYGSINSIPRFFASQANHYWYVNGRFVAHSLVQLFCAVAGKGAFAVANAMVYCLFVSLILYMCKVRRVLQSPGAVVTCICLVLLTFVTKMVPTTQIGFVWMFVLNLLWLKLFLNYRRMSPVAVALICLLGVLAGNGQEALSIGLSTALGLWWLHRRCRVGAARTAMLACYWLGTLAICLSPGTLGRAGAIHIPLTDSLVYAAFSLRATYVLLIVVAVLAWRGQLSLRTLYRQNALYLNAMAVLVIFNLVVGVYSNRQLFGIELFAIIVTLRTLPRHCLPRALNALALLLVAALFYAQAQGVASVRRQYAAIAAEYAIAPKGIVYFDRTLASTNIFMREFRYYEEIVGQFNNDTHHSLQKHLHYVHPKKKALHVWPTCIKGAKSVKDTIVCYAPQHYFVVSLDAKPVTPVVHIGTKSVPENIERATVKGKAWQGALIIPATPFARIDSVTAQ